MLIKPQRLLNSTVGSDTQHPTQHPTARRCRAGESQSPRSQRSASETPQLTPLSMVTRRRELDIDLNAPPPPDNGHLDGDFHMTANGHHHHRQRGSPEQQDGGESFGEDGMPRRKIQTRFSKRKVSCSDPERALP